MALILYVGTALRSLKAPMSKMKRTHGHQTAPIDEHVRFAHARKNKLRAGLSLLGGKGVLVVRVKTEKLPRWYGLRGQSVGWSPEARAKLRVLRVKGLIV